MKYFLFLLTCFFISIMSVAQWNSNTAVNNLITDVAGVGSRSNNVAVTDGAGGMFVAWIDSRTSSNQSIYVQRVLSNGTLSFTTEVLAANAVTAVAGSGNKSNLSIDADGAGGVILAWQDPRNITTTPANSNNDIYGQRINSAGALLWTTGGVRLSVSDNAVSSKINPKLAKVNATEAIVIFGDNRAGTSDIFAQKILLSTGAAQWAADVSIHGNQPNTQISFSVLADGAGGVFIVWQDPRLATSNSDIYAQKINNSGTLLWGASGAIVCNAVLNQLTPLMVSDGAGGITITWTDNRASAADGDIYAQRLDAMGVAQWADRKSVV